MVSWEGPFFYTVERAALEEEPGKPPQLARRDGRLVSLKISDCSILTILFAALCDNQALGYRIDEMVAKSPRSSFQNTR